MKSGVIYLKIRCRLAQDVDEETAQKFVEECFYKVDSTKEVKVEDTEIMDWATSANNWRNG